MLRKMLETELPTFLICKVCRGQNLKFFVEKNNWKIYKCRQCGLIFVWPSPKETYITYGKDYFCGATKGFGYVNYDEDKKPMISMFESYLKKIEKFLPNKGKLLDVGSATGFFLEIAKNRGWDIFGVEISEYAASRSREKLGGGL